VGGNAEVVRQGITGLVVPSGDQAGLTTAMRRLHDDPDEQARMGKEARKRIETHYSRESMVNQYQALYAKIADNHAANPDYS
jgi:glycosyltransferase involved in cell wall biosynthesis